MKTTKKKSLYSNPEVDVTQLGTSKIANPQVGKTSVFRAEAHLIARRIARGQKNS